MSKKIVILGAGKSSSYLIKYLYDKRKELNISLNVFSDYRPSYIDEFNEINFTILDIKDKEKLDAINGEIKSVKDASAQGALADMATFPIIMLIAYLILLFHFKNKGGYKPVEL